MWGGDQGGAGAVGKNRVFRGEPRAGAQGGAPLWTDLRYIFNVTISLLVGSCALVGGDCEQ